MMSKEAMKLALEALSASNDFLFNYHDCGPNNEREIDAYSEIRANNHEAFTAIREALAEQPAQRKYCRGDRLICLETEEYCVIHISGTDRQWVKFPDTHIGVYKNEQLAELFELLPKEIEIEQQEPGRNHYEDGDIFERIAAMKRRTAQQEPVTWRNAAMRVGEDLCSVGPFGYYDMTAEQWLDWALSVVTVHAPPAQRTWVGLTDEDEIDWDGGDLKSLSKAIEAKLKEKNT